jgi:hypothetical protein
MGLLDTFFGSPDQTRALGLLGIGMMNGNFGGGAEAAMGLLAEAPKRRLMEQKAQLEMQELQDKIAERQKQRQFLENLPDPTFAAGQQALAGGGGPTMANAAQVAPVSPQQQMMFQAAKAGVIGLPDYLKTLGPVEAPINKLDAKDFTPASLAKFAKSRNYADLERLDKLHFADVGGGIAALDPFTGQRRNQVAKTGNPFSDLLLSDGQGGFRQNAPLVGAKRSIAAAGAPQVNVNTDKSYFGNVAEGMAKNDVALIDAARSAPDRISSALRVKEILSKNPITGTGAEARLSVHRALATAGLVDAKDVANTEVLASTLASQTLDAIKSSGLGAGQGFTDKDRAFLERAKSGNIEMNSTTLYTLADLNERAARATIQRGNVVIDKLRKSPQAGSMGQQLDLVQEPKPPTVVRQPTGVPPSVDIDALVNKYAR